MFENNPLDEPREEFDRTKPGYINYKNKSEPAGTVQQLQPPYGYIYCLNLKRRAQHVKCCYFPIDQIYLTTRSVCAIK